METCFMCGEEMTGDQAQTPVPSWKTGDGEGEGDAGEYRDIHTEGCLPKWGQKRMLEEKGEASASGAARTDRPAPVSGRRRR